MYIPAVANEINYREVTNILSARRQREREGERITIRYLSGHCQQKNLTYTRASVTKRGYTRGMIIEHNGVADVAYC